MNKIQDQMPTDQAKSKLYIEVKDGWQSNNNAKNKWKNYIPNRFK
jgi:hypothetical protein